MTNSLSRYFHLPISKNIGVIFLLGFASGLPFLLILSTLNVWLTESGVTKTQLGIFAWASIPYAFKFIWAPMVDKVKLPYLCNKFGQRRGWLLFVQFGLFVSLWQLGNSDPSKLMMMAVSAFWVGCCSAMQDLLVEAYRIEISSVKKSGIAASASVLGYRSGMLVAGGGAMYIANCLNSWQQTYHILAIGSLIGMAAVFFAVEPIVATKQYSSKWLHNVVIEPLTTFINGQSWWVIIPFITFFKAIDAALNAVSMPFLLEIGFNKLEIAYVAKTFGISFMVIGGIVGGVLLSYMSLLRNILICFLLQFMASGLFAVQYILGHNISFLFVSSGVENFACGMGQVVLVAYLSRLCAKPYTAMNYALLSSFCSIVRVYSSSLVCWISDMVTWLDFYLVICFTCIPGLLIILGGKKHLVAGEVQ